MNQTIPTTGYLCTFMLNISLLHVFRKPFTFIYFEGKHNKIHNNINTYNGYKCLMLCEQAFKGNPTSIL